MCRLVVGDIRRRWVQSLLLIVMVVTTTTTLTLALTCATKSEAVRTDAGGDERPGLRGREGPRAGATRARQLASSRPCFMLRESRRPPDRFRSRSRGSPPGIKFPSTPKDANMAICRRPAAAHGRALGDIGRRGPRAGARRGARSARRRHSRSADIVSGRRDRAQHGTAVLPGLAARSVWLPRQMLSRCDRERAARLRARHQDGPTRRSTRSTTCEGLCHRRGRARERRTRDSHPCRRLSRDRARQKVSRLPRPCWRCARPPASPWSSADAWPSRPDASGC